MRLDPTPGLIRVAAAVITMAVLFAAPLTASAQDRVAVPNAPAAAPGREGPRPEAPASETPAPERRAIVVPAQPVVPSPLKGIVKELRNGPLLIHGNFCGIGNRRGTAPIDALDAACMRHDACTRTGKLPGCACNDRLRVEATLIARDPRTAADVRVVASATATAMAVLVCRAGGTVAVPVLPSPR